ncbi:AraC family transcriptional regulator [Paenibacillus sp. HB172176]|uniref:helix-turn-helix domain-containing protein n=1 Tax=Paenibacillus sp. HB172176 TaxID=2493690 RepID=UPI0014389023|nr:AraC family transcriptional regulator [Paenibacillus sp. HB172176]
MEAFNEKVPYDNPLLSLRVFKSQRTPPSYTDWHYHKQLELLLVLDGEIDVYLNDSHIRLGSGDVCMIGTSELHRDISLTALDYIVLQFDLEPFFDHSSIPYMRFFSEKHLPLSRINYIYQENLEVREETAACISRILEEATNKETGYELAVSILIKQILLVLLRNDTRGFLVAQDNFDKFRLKPVLDYIEDNLTERIQVEDACKIANMSYYYFVKFFKKTIGLSFTEYVNYQKIKRAERILLTKDLSISEVGEKIGMPNMAHFYKMFKKYNDCSPKQFQSRMFTWKRHS